MGRAYTSPEVVETEGGWFIRREADPDDEWVGDVEYLVVQTEGEWYSGGEFHEVFGKAIPSYRSRHEADIVLAAYRFGQEQVWYPRPIEG